MPGKGERARMPPEKSDRTVGDLLKTQAREDYNPIQAAAIGAGAASQSGLDQLQQAYLLARLGIAQKWQGDEAAAPFRQRIGDLMQDQGDRAALYQPLKQAQPYATGIGEAAPSFALGRGAGASALRWNMGTTALEDLAPATIGRLFAMRGK